MRVALIGEGPIDTVLVRALVARLAGARCGFSWPVAVDDEVDEFQIRKTGYGGVVLKVRKFIELSAEGVFPQYSLWLILLDRRTEQAQHDVKRAIRGRPDCILGIAIEEIEAWWLGDRKNVLVWVRLGADEVKALHYGACGYQAERDPRPKATLDELTRESGQFGDPYGEGNVDLAEEFAETWKDRANLDDIEHECPKGFRPLARRLQQALLRAKRLEAADRGQLPHTWP